jgi:hypothetical protein
LEKQNNLSKLFEDNEVIKKVKERLPYLFQLAELESQRAGKLGMEVGSIRERILVALLIYKFGEANVETEIPITEPEVDAKLFGQPISIKTITGKRFSGVKVIWTVDAQKAKKFLENYFPTCDILLAQINWNNGGGLYYVPLPVQQDIIGEMGSENYIKLPKSGTNPRGVEFNKNALVKLVENDQTLRIYIDWKRNTINFNPYKRWLDLWKED